MTKAEIVNQIATKTGIERITVQVIVESFMEAMKENMIKGENVYLRGFGSFVLKKRAEKLGRNITKNTTVIVPAHMIPFIKFCAEFLEEVATKVKVK